MESAIIVPARLASQRFPRKLLHLVQGKPIILWTADRIKKVTPDIPLYFAVGDEELETVLTKAGYNCILTDPNLPSGTDRIAVANKEIGARHVINVQADEPLVKAKEIRILHQLLKLGDCDLATLSTPIKLADDFNNRNRVKVVCDVNGNALYFSRAPIPFSRDGLELGGGMAQLHLGLYGYTEEFLETFSALAEGFLERVEKLEQLRALENGYRIAVGEVSGGGIGIDTEADAIRFNDMIQSGTAH